MIDPTELAYDRAIRGYVKLTTGLKYVIPGNENAPAPEVPYASALSIHDVKQGFTYGQHRFDDINDKVIVNSRSNQRVTYSIQIYRADNALELARLLTLYAATPTGQYYLETHKMVLTNWSTIRNLDKVIQDKEYERRAAVDLTFSLVASIEETINRIAEVDIALSTAAGQETLNIK